jgi:hypothetical protein
MMFIKTINLNQRFLPINGNLHSLSHKRETTSQTVICFYRCEMILIRLDKKKKEMRENIEKVKEREKRERSFCLIGRTRQNFFRLGDTGFLSVKYIIHSFIRRHNTITH